MGTIYCIRNKVDEKKYIGSTRDSKKRWAKHRGYLRGNRHPNPHLQAAWNKYGEENFEFVVIEENIEESLLLQRETEYIYHFKALDNNFGYNMREESGDGSYQHSEETRRKLSETHIGKRHSEETRQRISEANKGKERSDEWRDNLSKALKGHGISEEARNKISKAHKGKVLSEEHKEAISKSSTGKIHSPEAIKKLSEAHKGKKHTPEHTQKSSEANMKLYIFISPSQEIFVVKGLKRFCRIFDLTSAGITQVVKGKYSQHKGYTARYATPEEEATYSTLLLDKPYLKIS